MAEEEKGFVIRDRRVGGGEPSGGSATEPAGAEAAGAGGARPRRSEQADQAQAKPAPPVDFLSFVYSMGTSALMILGENPGQAAADPAPNLVHAQEIIDILTMLESKTKGNLTKDEETLLEEMLYTLRVKFVERASGRKPA